MLKATTRLLLPFLVLQVPCEGRIDSGIVRFDGDPENRWHFISKFGFDTGTSSWKIQFRLKNQDNSSERAEANLGIEAFIDETWTDALARRDHCERSELLKRRNSHQVTMDGAWSTWYNMSVNQNIRPHIWYFALSNCAGSFGDDQPYDVEWQMEMLQDGGSHLSVEMRGLTSANTANLIVFSGFMFVFCMRSKRFASSAGRLHPVIQFLFTTMLVQYVARCLQTFSLLQYYKRGTSSHSLDALGEVFLMLSQVCQSSLLILIGSGYTLFQSKLCGLRRSLPFCGIIAILHAVLVAVGKSNDGAHYKYHEFEGVVGWIILCIRVFLLAWFLRACGATSAQGGLHLQHFVFRFMAAGTLYFLAYPLFFLIFGFFAPYLQHGLMTVGIMLMQMASNLYLGELFLTRGEYFKVSSLSESQLPGGCKFGVFKGD